MWGESKQASSATMAVAYVTLGAVIDVWSVIWYIYLYRQGGSDNLFLVCYGLFFTGLVLMGIGLLVGRIGKAALDAEVSPVPPVMAAPVVTPEVATPAGTTTPAATATPVPQTGAAQPIPVNHH
jgi:hypothetical protein